MCDRRMRTFVGFEIGDEAGRLATGRFGRDVGDEIRAIDEQHPAAFGAARSATPRPMPCAAPVTTMTLPENRCMITPPLP